MVSENNDHYENRDNNCDGRMREGLHSLWRKALMLLLSSPKRNFNVYLEIYSNVLYSVVGFSYQVLRSHKTLFYCTLRL